MAEREERRRRTPWDRIVRAARNGTGCRLTPEDVVALERDSAIELRATLDAECFDAGHDPRTCSECES